MLRKFKPQGESAIIDRVVVSFSKAWTRDNPGNFSHPDTAYQLAFATLMVNTSLHNPNALQHAPDFVKDLKSFQKVVLKDLCGSEVKLTAGYLEYLYNSIRQRPIELVIDRYMTIFRDSVRSGWVAKRTQGSITKWKRRLLVLSGHRFIGYALYYFKAGKDRAWRMMIPLNAEIECAILSHDRLCFYVQRVDQQILNAAKRNEKGVTLRHERRRFVFQCSDEREVEYWVEMVRACLGRRAHDASEPTATTTRMTV